MTTKQDDSEAIFLSEKSKIMAELSSFSNKKEFLKLLQMWMSTSEDKAEDAKEDNVSVGSSQNYNPLNEDDCYGTEGVPELQ